MASITHLTQLRSSNGRGLTWCPNLRSEDIQYVCDGDGDVRSGGLIECAVSATPGSYDQKTHHAENRLAERDGRPVPSAPLMECDFLFTRADGSRFRLHPSHSTTKVNVKYVEPHRLPLPQVLGGSEGPGSYKRHVQSGVIKTLRFDGAKSCAKAKAKAATSSSFQ